MTRRYKRFLALEIEEEIIKAGLIETSKDCIFLKDIFSFSKDKKDIEGRIKKIRAYGKNTVILIPPRKVMFRYMELPSNSYEELKDMINFQLPRYLPYNFGEIVFDFRVVQETKEGYAKVMIACIQNQFFGEILESVPSLRDNICDVFLCGETGAELLLAAQREAAGTNALVDISSEEAVLSIFDSRGALFMRSLNISFFTQAENFPKGLDEMEKTFIAFGREFAERKIDSVVVSGAKFYAGNFYGFLKEHSSTAVQLFNPFDKEMRSEAANLLVRCGKGVAEKLNSLSFHAVAGAGVSSERRRINLIPPDFLLKKGKQLKKRAILQSFILSLIIISQGIFILYREIHWKKGYLDYLTDEIRKTAPKARAIEDKEKRTALIKTQLDMEGSSLDVLREVYNIMPANISINILIFEKNKSLSIRGTARTMAEVFNFIPQLERSPYFEKVLSEGTKMRKIKGEVAADFQIRALLKKRE